MKEEEANPELSVEAEERHGASTGDAADLFEGVASADLVLGDGASPVSEPEEADSNEDRIVPLFDETMKAPWEGAEEAWLASRGGETKTAETSAPCGETVGDEGIGHDQAKAPRDSHDAVVEPVSSGLVARREITRGHKIAIAAAVVFAAAAAFEGIWLIDSRDATDHLGRQLDALSQRLEARQRQISAIKEANEARVASLEARLASAAKAQEPDRGLVDQLQRNLEMARQDLALANEDMTTAEIDREAAAAALMRRHEAEIAAAAPPPERTATDPSKEALATAGEVGDEKDDGLDELLAGAVEGALKPVKGAAEEAEAKASNSLPEGGGADLAAAPSRDQVKAAMDLVQPRAKACAASGESGRILVKIQVAGATGRVTDARIVDDEFKGTPVAACVAREVRQAKFPKFAADSISIKYPFDL